MQPTSRRVDGDGGLSLHLLEWSSEGVPLLLLHGYGNEAHIWDDFAPAVCPHYRTLALDHRGHGDSAWDPEGRYDHDTLVRDVEAVTGALGIERMVLVAHSLGGRVATLFAGRHPERMAGLVLVDIGRSSTRAAPPGSGWRSSRTGSRASRRSKSMPGCSRSTIRRRSRRR
jgi:pimeloyl-ACP methyl ester carboxylesterase